MPRDASRVSITGARLDVATRTAASSEVVAAACFGHGIVNWRCDRSSKRAKPHDVKWGARMVEKAGSA